MHSSGLYSDWCEADIRDVRDVRSDPNVAYPNAESILQSWDLKKPKSWGFFEKRNPCLKKNKQSLSNLQYLNMGKVFNPR